MKSKKILIVAAGLEQCLAIDQARNLGYSVVACDQNPQAPGLNIADVAIVCDIRDVKNLIAVAEQYEVSGVFCHGVEIPEVVSRVAQSLQLPGLDPTVAYRCSNKLERAQVLRDANVASPKYLPIFSHQALSQMGSSLRYPLVMKPADNAGARGVSLVGGKSDLLAAYHEAKEYSNGGDVMLEEYLSGPQVSTESIVYRGKVITFAFADRNYEESSQFRPFFIEDGINFPTCLSEKNVVGIIRLVERAIEALGIDFGAAKGDIILHEGKPFILEMASRTSGGWFSSGSIPIGTGVNALVPLLQMSMGENPNLDLLQPSRNVGCAQRYWIPKEGGVLKSVTGLDRAAQMDGVKMFNSFFPDLGSRINRATNHAERFAQVICTAPTRDQAIQYAEAAIASIRVEIDAI